MIQSSAHHIHRTWRGSRCKIYVRLTWVLTSPAPILGSLQPSTHPRPSSPPSRRPPGLVIYSIVLNRQHISQTVHFRPRSYHPNSQSVANFKLTGYDDRCPNRKLVNLSPAKNDPDALAATTVTRAMYSSIRRVKSGSRAPRKSHRRCHGSRDARGTTGRCT